MTSKKRRGRRQESLPLEPATAGHARVESDVAGEEPARRRRRRSSATPAPEVVDVRVEGLLPSLPAPVTGREPVASEAVDMAVASDGSDAVEAALASGQVDTPAPAVAGGAMAGTMGPDACTAPAVRSEDPGVPVRAEDGAIGDVGPIGARLRAAREARGLTRDDLAAAARIPLSAIAHIEGGDLGALGAPIYARGFLRSYARTVGLPEVVVDAALQEVQAQEPALIVANPASVGDRFAARYKNPLVYALLTLVVVVPLVFLATPQSPRDPAPAFAPLDADLPAASGAPAIAGRTLEPEGDTAGTTPMTPAPPLPAPVMASMAPIASPIAAPRPAGTRVLALRVSEPSWIELTAADGRRLEYAQLPAGTTREYVVDGGADLVVGNVPGVAATLNGRPVDLNAVANRNVARLRVGDAPPAAGQ